MRIAPMMEEYGQDIHHVLQQDPDNFPYEYYSVQFSTFSGGHFAGFRRYLRHLFLDSARIDNEHAAQEYTRTVYSVNVPVLIGTGLKTVTGNRKCTSAPGICPP